MNSKLSKKVQTSVERIQRFDPKWFSDSGSYYLAFSGGKDSVVTKALMDMAGVKYDAHYRVTSVDPPELVRFIKEKHPDVSIDKPFYKDEVDKYGNPRQITMWNLIPRKLMPPTRIVRYCCSSLKEDGGDGRLTVTGVRWAESVKRKQNQGIVTVMNGGKKLKMEFPENFHSTKSGGVVLVNDNDESRDIMDACVTRHKTCLNPIIDWTDRDVWDFIQAEKIPYCGLYDEGFTRLGCIGCPMARKNGREREFARWPKYKEAYLKAFDRMLQERKKRGKLDGSWRTGTLAEDVYNWWMEYDILPGQFSFDDLEVDE